jgi:D-alanyl-lipoteichoic acid acyltransferase DltB (MBOAT superfamily)
MPRASTVLSTAAIALGLFLAADLALFWTPAYRSILEPESTTAAFETTVARLQAYQADRSRDVLVLGDSRIRTDLDPPAADRATGSRFRFINAGVAATTPRNWLYLARAADPDADRFRAVIVPVDTYADDDSALGSIDGDERVYDLHSVVLHTTPRDAWTIARSFADPHEQLEEFLNLLLRGPLLRDDVQAFLSDPLDRIRKLRESSATSSDPGALTRAYPLTTTLDGVRVRAGRPPTVVGIPPTIARAERDALVAELLHVAKPSPSYERYRYEWLAPIVTRYRAAGTPVIFVRVPAQPAHLPGWHAPQLSGSLAVLARGGALFLPQAPYLRLETPLLFADNHHLNADGMERFSTRLGLDVARALARIAGTPSARYTDARAFTTPPAPQHAFNLAVFFGAGAPIEFQSYEFFIFFAIVGALFYSVPKRIGRFVLLAASWYFYSRWNAWYVVFIIGLTVSDYLIARWMARVPSRPRRALLIAGVAANLAFLGVFKYANFSTGSLAALLGLERDPWIVAWLVPIGISFHTFQSISYLADVYRGRILAIRSPLDYALYIAFFPQLLAGPIVRAERFFGELYGWRRPNADEALRGIGEIALGLVKKTVVADQLATIADAYFGASAAHPGAPAAWSGILAFAFQIYFDFSGYSDIAIGSARLLGFDFPANFRRPYLAAGISEFWRRWHMTLSSWLRDYVYIPLGGNRHGRLATYRNVMATMLLGGLWHGAGWTFVGWGGYHGALLCLERRGDRPPTPPPADIRNLGWFGKVVVTFVLVCFGWILFRSQNFAQAVAIAHAAVAGGAGAWLLTPWMLVPVAIAACVAYAQERGWTPAGLRTRPLAYGGALACFLLALELLSVSGKPAPFVYFKF